MGTLGSRDLLYAYTHTCDILQAKMYGLCSIILLDHNFLSLNSGAEEVNIYNQGSKSLAKGVWDASLNL